MNEYIKGGDIIVFDNMIPDAMTDESICKKNVLNIDTKSNYSCVKSKGKYKAETKTTEV